jgi:hypothetical protein
MALVGLNQPLGTSMAPVSMTLSPDEAPPASPQQGPPPLRDPSVLALQQAAMNQLQSMPTQPQGANIGGSVGTLIGGIAGLALGQPALGAAIGGTLGGAAGNLIDEL